MRPARKQQLGRMKILSQWINISICTTWFITSHFVTFDPGFMEENYKRKKKKTFRSQKEME